MKKLVAVFTLLFSVNFIYAQKEKTRQPLFKSLIVGVNYTYVPDTETIGDIIYGPYREHTISFNGAVDIAKHFRVGIDVKMISTKGAISGNNKYNLVGLFGQYKFAESKGGFGFGELGYYKGNYCTCGDDIPYKKENLSYLNWGGGYNFKLYNNLRFDLAFTSAQVISNVKGRYAYTQYIVGLDYVIPFYKKDIK
jgi:hypothetical protein